MEGLGGDERARARELSLLEYQIDEIDAAGLDDPGRGRGARGGGRRARRRGGRPRSAAGRARRGRRSRGRRGRRRRGRARRRGRPSPSSPSACGRSRRSWPSVAHDLRVAAESVVEDPERLEAVRQRRRLLRELQRKYGDTLADVLAHRDEAAARLAELESHEARTAELEADRARVRGDRDRRPRAVCTRRAPRPRARSADGGARSGCGASRWPAPTLEVVVEAAEPGEDGADRVVFLLAANAGEAAQPLAKVASGGELSRAMLALRVALAERGGRGRGPVLVFDEVDAGIGGEAGAAVGRELAALARERPGTLHHPPRPGRGVRGCPDRRPEGGARRPDAWPRHARCSNEDRVAELSRMLAGVEDSAHARRHAEELLSEARRRTRAGPKARRRAEPR